LSYRLHSIQNAKASPDLEALNTRTSPSLSSKVSPSSSPNSPRTLSPRRRSILSTGGASDFQPIGTEVSEEKAQQLRNEVKRLSPVHVSLRERTLGEISLTSNSRRKPSELDVVTGISVNKHQQNLVLRLSRIDEVKFDLPKRLESLNSSYDHEHCNRVNLDKSLSSSKDIVDKLRIGDEVELPGCRPSAASAVFNDTEETDTTVIRLRQEQPEAFTDDSAESLALVVGVQDEVRSDGSDSGLGNEIPGDVCPTPAPESDSETSFLDRIPDDILSDKDKGQFHYSCIIVKSLGIN
jgi:hypothetical protein